MSWTRVLILARRRSGLYPHSNPVRRQDRVRQMAGHASIQTTADIYAHLDVDDLAEALQLLADKRAEQAGE